MDRQRRHLLGLLPSALLLGSASSSLSPLMAARRGKAAKRPPAALLLPLSGPSATLGVSMQRAAMLAQSPLSKPQDLMIFDTAGGAAAGATAAVQQAVKRGARIIIGPLFAEESRAAAQAAGGVPVISFSNDEDLVGSGAFLLGITASQSVTSILRYARGRGVKRVAVLGGASRWSAQGVAAAERLRGAAGLEVVVLPADTAPEQLRSALTRAGTGMPDAVLVTESGDALLRAARSMQDGDPQLLGTQQALDLPPGALRGVWLCGPDPASMSDFAQRYGSAGAAGPGLLAALAYDGMSIVEALRAGGVVDRSALSAVPSFAIATGPIRFAADGRAARELAVLVAGPDGFSVVDKSGSL